MNEKELEIELVAPLDDTSPVSDILSRMKNTSSPYHICYETENLEKAVNILRKKDLQS
jgi:hypothetical protein